MSFNRIIVILSYPCSCDNSSYTWVKYPPPPSPLGELGWTFSVERFLHVFHLNDCNTFCKNRRAGGGENKGINYAVTNKWIRVLVGPFLLSFFSSSIFTKLIYLKRSIFSISGQYFYYVFLSFSVNYVSKKLTTFFFFKIKSFVSFLLKKKFKTG
jgi:hypothetical protein